MEFAISLSGFWVIVLVFVLLTGAWHTVIGFYVDAKWLLSITKRAINYIRK